MKRGGTITCTVAAAALAACSTQPELQIRSTPVPLSATQKPVPVRIAEARAQFALGNVALALESFRKASREDPSSTDALAGIAACYDRMGRFDLSRRHYEMALAIAPADTQLLGAFAASLDVQGKRNEAAAVRGEIAARLAAKRAPAPAAVAPEPVAPVAPVNVAVVPAPVPVAKPAAVAAAPVRAVPAALPRPDLGAPQPRLAAATTPPGPVSIEPVAADDVAVRIADAPAPAEPAVAEVQLQPIAESEVGPSVTVKLPPPRPAAAAPKPAERLAAPLPAPKPVEVPVRVAEAAPPRESTGPRLERLSMGEVALVTSGDPIWKPTKVAQSDRSATVRFVPLRQASARPVRVRVLNAARVNRLAARTRSWLTARGWARMEIGDAPAVRARSVIFYPKGQRALAQTLSNQFGFAMEERSGARFVTMLLGRDAARIEELRPRNA